MLGALDLTKREAIVVGAGISGLLSAYRLDQAGFKVTLLEASQRSGGLIRTIKTPLGLVESAAHSILASNPVEKLFLELGVPLTPLKKEGRARFILRNGTPRRFPLSLPETLCASLLAASARADLRHESVTLEDWSNQVLGTAFTQRALSAFLLGIYGALPSEICVRAAFPALTTMQGKTLLGWFFSHKRRGKRPHMKAPLEGMGALVSALEIRLKERLGDRFKLDTQVTELPESPNVILCVPARKAIALVEKLDSVLAQALSKVNYVPLVSVTVFFKASDFLKVPRGIGVLMPPIENREVLGVLFSSSSFEGRALSPDNIALTAMLGGTISPGVIDLSDKEILKKVLRELRDNFGLKGSPIGVEISRIPQAIPCYGPGVLEVWRAARLGFCASPGRVLFGNYTGQVSIRGMIESVDHLTMAGP